MTEAQIRHLIKTYKEKESPELKSILRGLEHELVRKQDLIQAIKDELKARDAV